MQDVSMLLRVPRTSLGLLTSSRGMVQGALGVQLTEGGAWADCAEGRAIPGDCTAIESYGFYTCARSDQNLLPSPM
jgi:DNA topoisomerase VI subunit A